jgi:glutathione synthase/RimK-type ligase-like ATP-grasp enzyme
MKIGIFDTPDDPFIKDVVSQLAGYEVEFLSFGEHSIPPNADYKVIVYRYGYHDPYLTEILKLMSLKGTYVLNNPFTFSMTNKIMDASICDFLGIPHPKTITLPLLDEDDMEGLKQPDWDKIAKAIGFPCILKPFDGFAWENVFTVNTMGELKNLYTAMKGKTVMLVQELIKYKDYYRVFCVNKKHVLLIKWIPKPSGMGEYLYSELAEIEHVKKEIINWTVELNNVLDLDLNAVEWCIDEKGRPCVIEAFNDAPDVPKDKIPGSYYKWIVDRFVECIKEKANSNIRNRNIFSPSVLLKSC